MDTIYQLEGFIELGYQWIEKIEAEYRDPPSGGIGVVLDKYYRLVKEWEEHVKSGLPNASRKAEFSNAKSMDPTYESGKSVQIQNLIKDIRAKIEVLKEYKRELQQPSFNLGPQARVNINSADNSTNVIAGYLQNVDQLEVEFENNYAKPDKNELLKLIRELKTNEGNKTKTREILGTLLTRGAELAQVASLVAQLLR